jgi:hypothetical protein
MWYGSGFVTEISAGGTTAIFSTVLPGAGIQGASGFVAVDAAGNIYLTRATDSKLPTTPGAFQTTFGGYALDAFVAKITELQLPAVTLTPGSLTFGAQVLGTSTLQTVTLTNVGTAALDIAAIIIAGDYSQTNNCPLSPTMLSTGSSCTITVTFMPRSTGTSSGQLTITDNAWGNPRVVNLAGFGTSGVAKLSTNALTFGTQQVATTSAPQKVTLTNSGTTPLFISSVAATGEFAQTNNCPQVWRRQRIAQSM